MSFKRVINVVETHDGEPMRVVTGGVGYVPGDSVYEYGRVPAHEIGRSA